MPTLETQHSSASSAGNQVTGLLLPALAILSGRRTVAGFVLGFFIVGGLLCLVLPRQYTATARIFPRPTGQSGISSMLSQFAPLVSSDVNKGLSSDLFIAMLRSQSICAGLNDKFNLRDLYRAKTFEKTCKKLDSHVTISTERKDNVIEIAVDDPDPKRAADIANGYLEQLQALNERLAFSEADIRRSFFEKRLAQAKDDLTQSEIALQSVERRTGIIALDVQARSVVDSLARVRAEIAAKEVDLKSMETYATDNNPNRILLTTEIGALRSEQQKLESAQPSGLPTKSASELPNESIEYIRAYREVKYQEAMFEALLKQYETARIDEGKSPAVFEIIDHASVPEVAHKPNRTLILISSVVLGFVLGIFWVLGAFIWRQYLTVPKNQENWRRLRQELKTI